MAEENDFTPRGRELTGRKMLMIFGGGAIFDFALALFIGVITGTYASAFIAAPTMLAVRPKTAAVAAGK